MWQQEVGSRDEGRAAVITKRTKRRKIEQEVRTTEVLTLAALHSRSRNSREGERGKKINKKKISSSRQKARLFHCSLQSSVVFLSGARRELHKVHASKHLSLSVKVWRQLILNPSTALHGLVHTDTNPQPCSGTLFTSQCHEVSAQMGGSQCEQPKMRTSHDQSLSAPSEGTGPSFKAHACIYYWKIFSCRVSNCPIIPLHDKTIHRRKVNFPDYGHYPTPLSHTATFFSPSGSESRRDDITAGHQI